MTPWLVWSTAHVHGETGPSSPRANDPVLRRRLPYAFCNFQWKSVERFTRDEFKVLRLESHALASPIVFAALGIPLPALVNRFDFALRIKQRKHFGIRPDILTDAGRTSLSLRGLPSIWRNRSASFLGCEMEISYAQL
jgi:hypothetical protein